MHYIIHTTDYQIYIIHPFLQLQFSNITVESHFVGMPLNTIIFSIKILILLPMKYSYK